MGRDRDDSTHNERERDNRISSGDDEHDHHRHHRPTTSNHTTHHTAHHITDTSPQDTDINAANHLLERENNRLKTLCGSLRDELEAMEHSYRTERKKAMEYRSELDLRREESIRVDETVNALRSENQRLTRDLRSLRDQTDFGSAGSSSGGSSSSGFNRITSGIGVGVGNTSLSLGMGAGGVQSGTTGDAVAAVPSVIDRMELGNTSPLPIYPLCQHALSTHAINTSYQPPYQPHSQHMLSLTLHACLYFLCAIPRSPP